MAYELETELEAAGKHELLDIVHSIKPEDMECVFVRQPKMLGLGHAVLCAERLVNDDPFAVLLADDLMVGEVPIMKQMVEQFADWRASILAVQEVPAEHTKRYGIVAGTPVNDRLIDVSHMVEKPSPEEAPFTPGRRGPLHPDAGGVRGDPQPAARRGWRNPAHRRHRRPAAQGKGVRLSL